MLEVCAERARARRRRDRPAARRPARPAGRRARAARHHVRSARSCTWRPTRTGAGTRAPCGGCSTRRPLRLRRLRTVTGGHRRDARPLARARAEDLRARGLGRARAHADALGPRRRERVDDAARVARRRPSGARSSRTRASRSTPATAGSTGGRTPAARTRSGSPRRPDGSPRGGLSGPRRRLRRRGVRRRTST